MAALRSCCGSGLMAFRGSSTWTRRFPVSVNKASGLRNCRLLRSCRVSRPWFGLTPGCAPSVFSPEDVGHEQDEARRQACDHKLMDGEDVLQSVYPLLHGAGVEVVVDPSPNAPQRPHGIHHQRHGEAERAAQTPPLPYGLQERQKTDLLVFKTVIQKLNDLILWSEFLEYRKGSVCCPALFNLTSINSGDNMMDIQSASMAQAPHSGRST